jgi:8-oxo-dGTP pyrophosphatase MutT (NUDIX family)
MTTSPEGVAAERFRLAAAVYGILRQGGRVLLMRRAGSGYHDGELGLPSGHLDGGEDAMVGLLRELREELTITADPESCRLAVVLHRPPESPRYNEYLDLVFTVGCWTGTPSIGEPHKCSDLVWADPAQLPPDLVEYVGTALKDLQAGEPLVLYGWGH